MRNTILKKIMIAILTSLSLCLLLSVLGHIPTKEQEPNTSYMTFMGLFVLYLIFIAPVFLTVGVLFSIVVESKIKSISKTIVSYVFGGAISAFIYYLIIVGNQENTNILSEGLTLFISLGVISALLFYVIQIALNPLFNKMNFN